jgi:hypothetical protein
MVKPFEIEIGDTPIKKECTSFRMITLGIGTKINLVKIF